MTLPPVTPSRRESVTRAEQWFGQFWKLLVRVALLVFAGYFLWRVRSILTDVLVAAILAFALVGPVDALCRPRLRYIGRRAQRLVATLLVFAGLVYVVCVAVTFMLSPFRAEALSLSQNLPAYQHKALGLAASAKAWYAALPPDLRAFVQKQDAGNIGATPSAWVQGILGATATGIARIVDIVLVPVLAFYFVLDGHALRNEFLALLPRRRLREALTLLREAGAIMRTFVLAQVWLCVLAGVVVTLGLWAIGMKYALILGLLAGITRAIPIVGPIAGGVPIVLLALVMPGIGGPVLALKVLTFFSALHLVESKLIMPKFIGHRIHLHAALVLIVLLIGGEFFGLLGMFLAAPLAAIARVLLSFYVLAPRRRAERLRRKRDALPLMMKTQ